MNKAGAEAAAAAVYCYILEYKTWDSGLSHYKIGITSNLRRRRLENERRLPKWACTLSYKYEKTCEPGVSEFVMTHRYIAVYGMARVRGSCFDADSLYPTWVDNAHRNCAAMFNRCYKCLSTTHFNEQCQVTKKGSKRRFMRTGVPAVDAVGLLGGSWQSDRLARLRRRLEWTMTYPTKRIRETRSSTRGGAPWKTTS